MYSIFTNFSYPVQLSSQRILSICGVLLPLIAGWGIYALLRSEDILVNQWAARLGFSESMGALREIISPMNLPSWLVYNLPGGLWLFACTYVIQWLWHGHTQGWFWRLLPLIMALSFEFGQLFGYIKGTFDRQDLYFYGLGFILSIAFYTSINQPHTYYAKPN